MIIKKIYVFFYTTIFICLGLSLLYSEEKIFLGYASWYGDRFHGRKTASGEIYDMNKMTAAHKTLAFGTYVRVTNLNNQQSVILRINDRGPFKAKRILDVSKKAAADLNFLKEGIAKVKIEIIKAKTLKNKLDNKIADFLSDQKKDFRNKLDTSLSFDSSNLSETTNSSFKEKNKSNLIMSNKESKLYVIQALEQEKIVTEPIYKLQLGVYSNIIFAIKQQKALKEIGLNVIICVFEGDERLYRILTKKTFKDHNIANLMRQKMYQKRNIPSFVVQF